jgi:hypothetical protein
MASMALSALWYAASSLLLGRWAGSGWWWKRLLASGPQRRLWKNRNRSATLDALFCELVGAVGAVSPQQAMAFQFPQIIAELV